MSKASKLSAEALRQAMTAAKLDPALAESIIHNAAVLDQSKTATKKEPTKRTRKQFVVIINDPKGKVPDNLSCWVIQKTEYFDQEKKAVTAYGDLDVEERLVALKKAMDGNSKLIAKLGGLKSIADVFEFSTAKLSKEQGIIVKTKEPVSLIRVNGNEIFNPNNTDNE